MPRQTIMLIFFAVGAVALVPVLYYYYRRNPNPRFRPRVGEMVLLGLICFGMCGGASYFMSGLITSDPRLNEDSLNMSTSSGMSAAEKEAADEQNFGSGRSRGGRSGKSKSGSGGRGGGSGGRGGGGGGLFK